MMRHGLLIPLAVVLMAHALCAGTFKGVERVPRKTREPRVQAQPDTLARISPALAPAEAELPGAISPGGAFIRSLVVPGWGQSVLARSRPEIKGRGKGGFWLDVGMVAGAWGLMRYSEIKQNEYQAYAHLAAGAGSRGDGSDYWVHVSNYLSRADFNQAMLEINSPNLRYLDPADDWQWPSWSSRSRYRNMRARSERAAAQSLAVGGAIFINHVLSAVQALRLANDSQSFSAVPVPGGVGLAWSLDLTTPGRH